jgi:hypothetical protein
LQRKINSDQKETGPQFDFNEVVNEINILRKDVHGLEESNVKTVEQRKQSVDSDVSEGLF